mmetsp:Transcript_28108/g.83266  ORF Transcript_28108/g.83266 Transcript_28108/m.83266 type:complete len:1023 (+) Transcript_28108:280-3348(+)
MLASPGMHAALARMAAASRSMAAHGSSATPAAASSAWQCIDVMARPVTMTASDTIQGIQLRPPKLRRITTCVAARWAVDSGTPPPRLPAGPPDGGDEPPPATSSSSRRFAAQFNLTDAMVQVESQSAALADEGAARLILKPHMAQSIQESMKLIQLVRAYQTVGHFAAALDPLGMDARQPSPTLDPTYYGFTEADMDRQFYIGIWSQQGFLTESRPVRTLRELHAMLRATYCSTVGYEYMHIQDPLRRTWLQQRIELPTPPQPTQEEQLLLLDRLSWSSMFETFLAEKFKATKRFGLEGGEALIPGMTHLIDTAADLGVESVVMGMPHRGRLNVLANVVRKPLVQIFSEFSGKPIAMAEGDDDAYVGSGDVKYHLGTSCVRPTVSGRMVSLSLLANPSHLEAINTVVLGKARAKQFYGGDRARKRVLPILIHGDGAFAGEGIVYETLDMTALTNYTVGGTVHFVLNNQIAFTTDPKESRSSPYCTDVARSLNAPIFHVNGDDAEAVVRVCALAMEWRQTFHTDVVIDVVCYRRHGHNENDEPAYTQPLMYKNIRSHASPLHVYMHKLAKEGSVSQAQIDATAGAVRGALEAAWTAAETFCLPADELDWLSNNWQGFNTPLQLSPVQNTGVPMDALKTVGRKINVLPCDIKVHKHVSQMYAARLQSIESGEGIDWACAEALAFATLLSEGNHVRLSGQDVERGTFNHRHAVLHDQDNGRRYTPLEQVYPGQLPGQFTVCNSSLSEFGVLGFELGYSMENPDCLAIWEAQFGDFANCAQVIFDQFLSSGESKWLRQTGLVVMLPHGYDGQGPEHSSARIERFLQMCDEDPYDVPEVDFDKWFDGNQNGCQLQSTNWQVVNCTTPANYFHVLRRQVRRQFRKPLILFSPKNLLRHARCKSPLRELDDVPEDVGIVGVRFKRLIPDDSGLQPKSRAPFPPVEPDVRRMVLCSGKVFYSLQQQRRVAGLDAGQIAIVRLEQLSPFPFDLVCRELRRYPNAEVVWCQEEPMNMGAYHHVQPRVVTCLE